MKTGSETGFPILTSSFQTPVKVITTTHMINYATQIKGVQNIVITSSEKKNLHKFSFSNDQTKKPSQAHACSTGAIPKDTSKIKLLAGFTFQKPTLEKNSKKSGPAIVLSPFSGCVFASKPTNIRVDTSAPQISILKTSGGTRFPILTPSLQTSVTTSTSTQVADNLMQFNVAQNIVTTLSEGKSLFKIAFSNDQTIKPSQANPSSNDLNEQNTSKINPSVEFTFQKPAPVMNTHHYRNQQIFK